MAACAQCGAAVPAGARKAEAPDWLQPGTYVEPFALRALGVAREDETLVRQAAGRFEAIGLDWHAGETRKLLPS